MENKINQAIKDALEGAPKRKFVESMDIAFTIRDVDLKNPNNRIKEEIRLPSGRGRVLKIAMFASNWKLYEMWVRKGSQHEANMAQAWWQKVVVFLDGFFEASGNIGGVARVTRGCCDHHTFSSRSPRAAPYDQG